MNWARQEKELVYLRSTIKCSSCNVIFPIEYKICPQCELDKIYQRLAINHQTIFGGKKN